MARQLMKGNEAIAYSAILAGCRAFYGYPITPSSEIAEAAALYLPQVGGVFLQAESEVAAINMMYGAAAAGVRVMTASSGPGVSLMQEGISYMACAELPCVIADVMRAGPGLGNVGPEQADYFQVVKGGGHGNYRTIVLAPASAQEAVDLTRLAFELADEYRNPAYVLMDACIGQVMEPVEFPRDVIAPSTPPWAVAGSAESRRNVITSIYLDPPDMERHIQKLEAKYRRLEARHVLAERYRTDDAEIVLVGYGIVSRVLQAVVEQLREHGLRVGMLRPITLFPFPSDILREVAVHARLFAVVEMSTGQMVEDVRLALNGRRPVEFYGRYGGVVPSAEEVLDFVAGLAARLANEEVLRG
ncbi:MAG: 3-methyl-2-oxobutanoate dehydrogenase subunit VorB [Bryobacteraceae bacterium]|jgi:pyruvate/2-oxoacid:ferredoxin oxidoreductase alpha subunit